MFVDTDSAEIIKDVRSDPRLKNVTVYNRGEQLVGDKVSVCDLIENFILSHRLENEYICQLHVTSPFLTTGLLENAFEKTNEGYDSIVSCNKVQSRLWRQETYGYAPINHNPIRLEQTQDLPVYYEENSIFYIFRIKDFIKTKLRVGTNPYFYSVSFPYNIDIDTEDDWKLVERMIGK